MGGRSRSEKPQGRWDFIQELSDDRLQRYGVMSFNKFNSETRWESPGKSSLNWEAANEYERRHGERPWWERKETW